jgi:hypothetical protein
VFVLSRSQRLDRVACDIEQVEVDCGLALGVFAGGRVHETERSLRIARDRLTRAITTLKRRGSL